MGDFNMFLLFSKLFLQTLFPYYYIILLIHKQHENIGQSTIFHRHLSNEAIRRKPHVRNELQESHGIVFDHKQNLPQWPANRKQK